MKGARISVCALRLSLASLLLLTVLQGAALAASWGCYGTKPGHPTREEKMAFIREVSPLAINAEKKHGVPASALVAMAIGESGYGWTRVALEANNPFGWKVGSAAAAEGRKSYTPGCQSRRRVKVQYLVFKSRADAFEFVASKLASLDAYREYTEAYKAARARGDPAEPAVKAWLSGIASRYSSKPAEFTKKISRIMNNAMEPADRVSPDYNLGHLSAR